MKLQELFEQKLTDYQEWMAAVKKAYPGVKLQFKSDPDDKTDNTIIAVVKGEDRCYGVWDQAKEQGEVLGESMKLSDITKLTLISEGRVDPNIMLSLQRVIQHGKVTDGMQNIVLARMLEYFRMGMFYREPNFYEVTVSTPKALLDTVRALEPKDAVALAAKILELLNMKDKDLLYSYANPTQEALAWVMWATRREANQ